MRTVFLAKALLVVAFAMTLSFPATADPIVCEPESAIAPIESESGAEGFFQRLLGVSSEKPQAFSGAVMDDADGGCSLGLDTRPTASEQKPRARREAIN